MSHVKNKRKYFAPSKILPWSSLSNETTKVVKESGGSVGFIPFYETSEEVVKLFGCIKILEFQSVEEEITREEEDGPQGLGKREVVPQKRKGCCGGKACKVARPATEGDGGCH